jgi:hypothetical protein
MLRRYEDRDFPARDLAVMPAARAALLPWLIAGRLLFAPFAPRDGGPTAGEAEAIEAIEAMGERLDRDRRAGLLPDSVAFWLSPVDGRITPLTASQAWLRIRVLQHVVVDMRLLQAMGRVVPLTLLSPTVPGRHRVLTRRAPKVQVSIEAAATA